MKGFYLAGSAPLILALLLAHASAQTKVPVQTVLRLKSTLDVGDVTIVYTHPIDALTYVRRDPYSFNPINKTLLLQRKKWWQLFDVSNGTITATFPASKATPFLSPSAQQMLVKRGKSANLWNTTTRQKLCVLAPLPKRIIQLEWSPDETKLMLLKEYTGFKAALLDNERTEGHLYDTNTCQLKFTFWIKSLDVKAKFSPDSRSILAAGGRDDARLLDASTGRVTATLSPPARALDIEASGWFSPDGKTIVISSYYRGISLWDAHSGTFRINLTESNFGDDTYAVRGFSPDSKLLMLYRERSKGIFSTESTIELRDTSTGKTTVVLRGGNMRDSAQQVEWSYDGNRVVTAGGNTEYNGKIWDVRTGKLIATFPMVAKVSKNPLDVGYKDLDFLSFHPTLPIFTAVNKNFVRLWDAGTGELMQVLENATYPAQWTEDGQLLLTKTNNGKTLQIWELAGG